MNDSKVPSEQRRFRLDLKLNVGVMVITIASTMALMVDQYFDITPVKVYGRTILYLVVPLVIIILGFRRNPAAFGFRLGDWRMGSLITLASIIVLAPVIWIVVRSSDAMQTYYQSTDLTTRVFLFTLLELFGWEFFFRGFIFFGYQEKFGDHALWLQAVPFALAHLGKPAVETLTTLFGGFLFGLVARRTRSFLYPFLIHLFVALFTKHVALSMV